ncbi:hypothetical protein GCM10011391_24970 [Pullulanibacillus camelliae]|uniref:SDR family oxidoreductase n=2 Tax=Pullulanibacillus camelliae TaxID=1707096 RepID=A0A8J3DU09_9BACL|nr:hypothetical protein GCM10011391_24970 [Pullulanibacillus camelliae]
MLTTTGAEKEHQEKLAKVPIHRAALPKEIANGVLYFADATEAGYIIGQELYSDGGYTAGQLFSTFEEA